MNASAAVRILLVDDHALFRRGVAQLIDADPQLELVGEAGTGAEGLARAGELDPDVILLDLNMRDMHGLEVLEAMRARGQRGRIVMLTVSDRKQDAIAALRLGASGYLLKDMGPDIQSTGNPKSGCVQISNGQKQVGRLIVQFSNGFGIQKGTF